MYFYFLLEDTQRRSTAPIYEITTVILLHTSKCWLICLEVEGHYTWQELWIEVE
jgi:hypothetical protein